MRKMSPSECRSQMELVLAPSEYCFYKHVCPLNTSLAQRIVHRERHFQWIQLLSRKRQKEVESKKRLRYFLCVQEGIPLRTCPPICLPSLSILTSLSPKNSSLSVLLYILEHISLPALYLIFKNMVESALDNSTVLVSCPYLGQTTWEN